MSGLPSLRVTALRRREQHPNLLAAWGFAEGSGTVARDSSEHNLPLTVDAALTWPAGHSGGTALSNSAAASAHRSWSLSGTITIMGWVKPLDLTAGTSRPLFGIWDNSSATSNTQVALWAQRHNFSTSNVLQGNVRVGGGLTAVNDVALTLNTWVHLALSYDGTNSRLWKNGVNVATFAITGTITPGTFSFNVVPDAANATVDDVRVFNTALNAAQITAFMGDPVAP